MAYFNCSRIISKNCLVHLGRGIIPEEKVCFGQNHNCRTHCKQQVSANVRELRNNMVPAEDLMTDSRAKGRGRMLWRKVHAAC